MRGSTAVACPRTYRLAVGFELRGGVEQLLRKRRHQHPDARLVFGALVPRRLAVERPDIRMPCWDCVGERNTAGYACTLRRLPHWTGTGGLVAAVPTSGGGEAESA